MTTHSACGSRAALLVVAILLMTAARAQTSPAPRLTDDSSQAPLFENIPADGARTLRVGGGNAGQFLYDVPALTNAPFKAALDALQTNFRASAGVTNALFKVDADIPAGVRVTVSGGKELGIFAALEKFVAGASSPMTYRFEPSAIVFRRETTPLVREAAKLMHEPKDLDAAEAKLRKVLHADPLNPSAFYYLTRIQDARWPKEYNTLSSTIQVQAERTQFVRIYKAFPKNHFADALELTPDDPLKRFRMVQQALKGTLEQNGAKFPELPKNIESPSLLAAPPELGVFDDKGILVVIATFAEIDMIEHALHSIKQAAK